MFQCKDLLSLTTMSQADVIAGSGGMEKGIRWSYKAENINFPLFTMPWNVPLLDFFEELGHAISYLDDRKDIEDSLLAEIIFGNCINTSSIEQKCRQMGYDLGVLEQVFVLHLSEQNSKEICNRLKYNNDEPSDECTWKKQRITNDQIRSYAQTLKEYFSQCNYPAIVSCYGDRIIGFMRNCAGDRKKIIEIFERFAKFLQNDPNEIEYTLNIGETCENLSKLQKSFHETSKTNSVLEHINRKNKIVFYDEIGFYRMLMSYENTAPMQQFANEVLSPVIQYEKKAHTQLIETMWAYFECDCNLQRTADKLFSHKNTVKYRLHRVEQLTGKNFTNRYQSQELYNALMIYYFLEKG